MLVPRAIRRLTGRKAAPDIIGADLWFGREGIIPDEWAFAKLRAEVASYAPEGAADRAEMDYAQDVVFEQARLLTLDEASELQAKVERVSMLGRPRMERQHGIYWEDAFQPLGDPFRPWPVEMFGEPPSFEVCIRVVQWMSSDG